MRSEPGILFNERSDRRSIVSRVILVGRGVEVLKVRVSSEFIVCCVAMLRFAFFMVRYLCYFELLLQKMISGFCLPHADIHFFHILLVWPTYALLQSP